MNLTIRESSPWPRAASSRARLITSCGVRMTVMRRTGWRTVNKHGAVAGCVLRGAGTNNQGLRLRILQEQARGNDGPLKGGFVILDVGDNKHSQSLAGLLQQVTDAEEVLGVIRQLY